MGLSEQVVANRKRMGLTQRQLADLLDVSQTTISLWESNKMAPSTLNIIELEMVFGMPMGELLLQFAREVSTEARRKN